MLYFELFLAVIAKAEGKADKRFLCLCVVLYTYIMHNLDQSSFDFSCPLSAIKDKEY